IDWVVWAILNLNHLIKGHQTERHMLEASYQRTPNRTTLVGGISAVNDSQYRHKCPSNPRRLDPFSSSDVDKPSTPFTLRRHATGDNRYSGRVVAPDGSGKSVIPE
ncbi:hypothetical protein BaRGS_00021125, partial [Batillaria attramentaria]